MRVSLSLSLFSSVFLGKIKEAFDRDAELQNLLLDTFFSNAVQDCQVQLRRVGLICPEMLILGHFEPFSPHNG